ncbi:MAG TPA: flagellar basal-body rod protein FlgF [Burkholderiaceae bacterium]|nr:flagellar basal-body rod protein FlgF [Burkholderiaceae bacterium]
MDRVIYTAMSGAKNLLYRQDTLASNLANASTTGFRAQTVALRAVPARGAEAGTRVFTVETTLGNDFTPGPMQNTGRELDVAVQGAGWLVVQANDGSEAYTRAGNLQVSPDGVLQTPSGLPVMGEGGEITVPIDGQITIGADGTISAKLPNQAQTNQVGRLKLVNPPAGDLTKGTDGLFRTSDGSDAEADPNVRVASGQLEGSNVNVVDAMIGMISAARQFEMQLKLLDSAQQNEQKAGSLISGS